MTIGQTDSKRKLRIVDRRHEFDRRRTSDEPQTRDASGIVIHHSVTAHRRTGRPLDRKSPAFFYHAENPHWRPDKYHYIIEPDGTIVYAVDEQVHLELDAGCTVKVNATVPRHPGHFISICMLGWFDSERAYNNILSDERIIPERYTAPTAKQRASLRVLIQELCTRLNIPLEKVYGHRELVDGSTSCPGHNLDLEGLREEMAARESSSFPQERILIKLGAYSRYDFMSSLNTVLNLGLKTLVKAAPFIYVGFVIWALWRSASLIASLVLFIPIALITPFVLLRWWTPRLSTFMRRLTRQNPDIPIQHQWLPFKIGPSHLYQMLLTGEDARFFQHPGFNLAQTFRAAQANVLGVKLVGESTITQQTARTIFLWPERSVLRKALEYITAIVLEMVLPKWRILELYANFVQTGENLFGVEAASRAAFNKTAAELTKEESAMIAAILPNPILLDAANPTPELEEQCDRLLQGSYPQSKFIKRTNTYPVLALSSTTIPPLEINPDVERLLAYLSITCEEFEAHQARYFAELSRLLNRHRDFKGRVKVDSSNFAEAVKDFQKSAGLETTGLPDEDTLWALQVPYSARHRREIKQVLVDIWVRPEREGYEPARDGYTSFRLRADAAQRLSRLCEEIHHYGGIVTSAGGTRHINSPTGVGQSLTSMHIAGLAFDLAVPSGILDPQVDPFIITRDGDLWRVWARAERGTMRELETVVWHDGQVHTVNLNAHVIDFNTLARKYGFHSIPPRSGFPEEHISAEWWHFQCDDLLVPWISQYGSEILSLKDYNISDLKASQRVWPSRKRIFMKNPIETGWH